MLIPAYDGYVFDLDGTIFLGDTLLPGAQTVIDRLRVQGRQIAFVSNNPTHTREQYVAKLTRLGVHVLPNEVINSSYVMVQWLREHAPNACLYVVGEQPLIEELAAAGFRLSERPSEITLVIASFDRTFTYHKLQVAFDAIRAGAQLVATNADRFCPVPSGGQPDAAAIIAAIEACTNTTCAVVVGKPSAVMARTASAFLGLPLARCLMVGDRLETDIMMGATAGMATALVLTGASTRADLATVRHLPDYVIENLFALISGQTTV